jgi:hypothetical protein
MLKKKLSRGKSNLKFTYADQEMMMQFRGVETIRELRRELLTQERKLS